ncbi:mitochondrial fission factor-like isoform X1 [Carettochelys insculpta]|uniref:mitochondrial fission factor-like isoform X1 n=1 Tax=Carettochelys insculpta TaxID=44489 RepID=UPI003EBA55BC
MMWPFRGLEVTRAPCDLSFMEAIGQRMQVPNRLKVAEESGLAEERGAEALSPSFQMHVPERLSVAEVTDTKLRPLLLDQRQRQPSLVHRPRDPSTQRAPFGDCSFLDAATRSGTPKHKRSAHQGRLRKERAPSKTPQIAMHSVSQMPARPDTCPLPSPPYPPFPQDGRIYSLQSILQMVCFLGHLLFHRVKKSARDRDRLSSQDTGLGSESSLEESGATDIIAMRKQLNKILGRLRTLEKQSTGWRQKELLVYSVLVSACLVNTWLWLRR